MTANWRCAHGSTGADGVNLLFEEDRDKVYDEAMKRRTQNL